MSDGNELIAAWMVRQGFATGHGDTTEEILVELDWQVAEIKARRDELLEALEKVDSYWSSPGEDDWVTHYNTVLQPVRAAIAKARGENNEV